METLRADFWHSITFQQVRPTDLENTQAALWTSAEICRAGSVQKDSQQSPADRQILPCHSHSHSDITISAITQICALLALDTTMFFPANQCYRFPLPSPGLVEWLLFKAFFNISPSLNPVPRQKRGREERDRASKWHRSPWLDCYFFSGDSKSSL